MRLKSVRVRNYRSINDSGTVDIDPEITGIVGMTGSGKTSFLKMVSGIDKNKVFAEVEIPRGSSTQEQFTDGKLLPENIPQLDASFRIEESDRLSLPQEYKHIEEIRITRTFGGTVNVATIPDCSAKINLDAHAAKLKSSCNELTDNFTACTARVPALDADKNEFGSRLQELADLDLLDRDGANLIITSLRNLIDGGPADEALRVYFQKWTDSVAQLLNEAGNTTREHPAQKLYDMIPKPHYMDGPFELDAEVGLDEFVADMSISATFRSIAVITGLTAASIQKIRSDSLEERNSYLETKSKRLSDCINRFWRQEKYTLLLDINNGTLRLMVRDETTGTNTSVAERSTGFRWWAAFFLEISAFMADKSGRRILLLDNPATELHDEGKADVLQFMTNACGAGKLQILYSTHERALVEPWRTDRIRAVELTEEGSKIYNVRNMPGLDMAGTVLKYIGSPARYSLFGAPRTILFEGVSDTNIVSAVNEYRQLHCKDNYLKRDMFSINAVGGLGNAPLFCKLYRNLKLDFVIVTDSGTATEDMKKKLQDGDYERFVEIKQVLGRDGDIEDLVDPGLYHEAFRRAYSGVLGEVPSLAEIESSGGDRKRVNQYEEWFRRHGKSFSKALVAQCMFDVLISNPAEREPAKYTTERFVALFKEIAARFES